MRWGFTAFCLVIFCFTSANADIPRRVLKCSAKAPLKTSEGQFDSVRVLFHGNQASNSETADLILETDADPSKSIRHNCALSTSSGSQYEFSIEANTETVAKRTFFNYDTRIRYTISKEKGPKGGYFWAGSDRLDCVEESPDLYEKSRCVRGFARSNAPFIACEVADAAKAKLFQPDVFSAACKDVGGKESVCQGHLNSLCSLNPLKHLFENPYEGYDTQGQLVQCSGDVGEVFSGRADPYREQCRFLGGVALRGCKNSGPLCSLKVEWPLKPNP
jgi:hypothetical protein